LQSLSLVLLPISAPEPLGQVVQAVAALFNVGYEPFWQKPQVSESAPAFAMYLPSIQDTQALLLAVLLYFPATHCVHEAAVVAVVYPLLQTQSPESDGPALDSQAALQKV
jgi:hypothetical protein